MRESARKPGGGEREHTSDLSAMTLTRSRAAFEWFCDLLAHATQTKCYVGFTSAFLYRSNKPKEVWAFVE